MNARDLILVLIALVGNRSEFGRTSLQKLTYFAGLTLVVDLGHHAYYYGPFSERVEHEVQMLALSGLIQETVRNLGFVNQAGFAIRHFSYNLTPDGISRTDAIRSRHPHELHKVEELVSFLEKEFSGLDQASLSTAAKVTYLLRQEGKSLSTDEVTTLASAQGWSISPTAVARVKQVASIFGK
jgi:uncharacterized protein YwgA